MPTGRARTRPGRQRRGDPEIPPARARRPPVVVFGDGSRRATSPTSPTRPPASCWPVTRRRSAGRHDRSRQRWRDCDQRPRASVAAAARRHRRVDRTRRAETGRRAPPACRHDPRRPASSATARASRWPRGWRRCWIGIAPPAPIPNSCCGRKSSATGVRAEPCNGSAVCPAVAWRGRSGCRAARHPLRLGDPGPGGGGVRGAIRRGRGAPHACARLDRDRRAAPALRAADVGPGDEVWSPSAFLHRHGQRHPPLRRDAGLRRHRRGDLEHRARGGRAGYRSPRTKRDPRRPPARHALRHRGLAAIAGARGLCRSSRTRRAPSAARFASTACGTGSAVRMAMPPVFSFHPRKLLTTGDGGMVTTRHPAWAERLRRARHHGMSAPDSRVTTPRAAPSSRAIRARLQLPLTDIQAAVGREQLRRLPATVERRASSRPLPRDSPRRARRDPSRSRHSPDATGRPTASCSRAGLDADGRHAPDARLGVATRRGVMCAHREASYPGQAVLPVTERIAATSFQLPMHPGLTEIQHTRVIAAVRKVLES